MSGGLLDQVQHHLHELLAGMKDWPCTMAKLREAVFGGNVTALDLTFLADRFTDPDEAYRFMPSQAEVHGIWSGMLGAVRAGRVFDMGWLPNAALMAAGKRGSTLFNAGVLHPPFTDCWIISHRWEGGVCIYAVRSAEGDDPCALEVIELRPVILAEMELLMIGDRAYVRRAADKPAYECSPFPMAFRFLKVPEGAPPGTFNLASGDPYASAASNALDPVMATLLILNTRGIERTTVAAPAKLQRARAKNRKPPIPPYEVIATGPYVTAILGRGNRARGEDRGGTHASPQFHIRIGHPRTYQRTGQQLWIADTLVNASAEARAAFKAGGGAGNRSHYVIRPNPEAAP